MDNKLFKNLLEIWIFLIAYKTSSYLFFALCTEPNDPFPNNPISSNSSSYLPSCNCVL